MYVFLIHSYSLVEDAAANDSNASKSDRCNSSSPPQYNHDFIAINTEANWTSFFDMTCSARLAAPQTRSLHACQLALDCIVYPSEGPLGPTIITMLKQALPGT